MDYMQNIFKKIAAEHGTKPELVRKVIQQAIDEAFHHHPAAAQPFWDSLSAAGQPPAAEAFVLQVVRLLTEEETENPFVTDAESGV